MFHAGTFVPNWSWTAPVADPAPVVWPWPVNMTILPTRVKYALALVTPSHQFPLGMTLDPRRRRAFIERVPLVIEDDYDGEFRYDRQPVGALQALAPGQVVYAGTASKSLAPGLRLGWLVAPPPVLHQLALGKGSADLCSSSVSQYFIAEYFRSGPWMNYVRSLSELYRRRRDVMLDAMAEQFPREATWTHPEGGLFLWATLPDYIDTTDLLARALDEHVAFVPGRAAYLDGRGGSSMRLNFSGVGENEIREGIRRIGEIVSEQVALYSTLTGGRKFCGLRSSRRLRRANRTAPTSTIRQ